LRAVTSGKLERIVADDPALLVELQHGITHEGALTASDLIDRRTRVGLITGTREYALEAAQARFGDQLLAAAAAM
jgi:glycerol-3-phosphate dehydrogenase